MHVVLEIVAGPAAGGRIVVGPGKTIRVGRTIQADFVIAEDTFLSGTHFSIENDGTAARLHDLQSTNGVFLNGARTAHGELQPGDEISASFNRFWVSFRQTEEALETAPAAEPEPSEPLRRTLRLPVATESAPPLAGLHRQVLEFLEGQRVPLFALLDAAQDPLVLGLLREGKDEFECLYDGRSAQDLANFAPYLIALSAGSLLLPHLVHHGWTNNWGVYLTSARPLEEVRKHFRRFLMVDTEAGKKLYFRFYDPRVLRAFLPKFTPEQSLAFFGTIQEYLAPAEEPKIVLRFRLGQGRLHREEQVLLKAGDA